MSIQLQGWVIIINGDGGCRFQQPVQVDSQPKSSSGLVLGRRLLGAILHSSNEIIIIIIIIIAVITIMFRNRWILIFYLGYVFEYAVFETCRFFNKLEMNVATSKYTLQMMSNEARETHFHLSKLVHLLISTSHSNKHECFTFLKKSIISNSCFCRDISDLTSE